jgi:hypothetical protein
MPYAWYRMYNSAVTDPKVRSLSNADIGLWTLLLCLASEQEPRGTLPSVKHMARHLRCTPTEVLDLLGRLVEADLMEEHEGGYRPHNWDSRQFASDNSTPRVQKHRDYVKRYRNVSPSDICNLSGIRKDTDTDTDAATLLKRYIGTRQNATGGDTHGNGPQRWVGERERRGAPLGLGPTETEQDGAASRRRIAEQIRAAGGREPAAWGLTPAAREQTPDTRPETDPGTKGRDSGISESQIPGGNQNTA